MKDAAPSPVALSRMNAKLDAGAGERARIGLLVLESDRTLEWEMGQMARLAGVAFYHARLANDPIVSAASLAKMEQELPVAAGLLPQDLGLKSIGYGCTSGSTIIGETRVADIVNAKHPGVPCSNPMTAAKAALKAMGVKRLGLVTPYVPDVTNAMQKEFANSGLHVRNVASFYEEDDAVVARISPASVLEAIKKVGSSDDVDGVFVSCTSIRAAGIIDEAEECLGKPVTASNHALCWHLLRLAGITDEIQGHGRLFKSQL